MDAKYVTCECHLANDEGRYLGTHGMENFIRAWSKWLCPSDWSCQGVMSGHRVHNILNLGSRHHGFYIAMDSPRPILFVQDAADPALPVVATISLTKDQEERWLQQLDVLRRWHIKVVGWDPLIRHELKRKAERVRGKFAARCNLDPNSPLAYGIYREPRPPGSPPGPEILRPFAENDALHHQCTFLSDDRAWMKPADISWIKYSQLALNMARAAGIKVYFNLDYVNPDHVFYKVRIPPGICPSALAFHAIRHLRKNWDSGFSNIVVWCRGGQRETAPPWDWPESTVKTLPATILDESGTTSTDTLLADRECLLEATGGSLRIRGWNTEGKYAVCLGEFIGDGWTQEMGGHGLDQVVRALVEWLSSVESLPDDPRYREAGFHGVTAFTDPHYTLYAEIHAAEPTLWVQEDREVEWIGRMTLDDQQRAKWLAQLEDLRQWHIAVKGWDPLAR